MRWDIEQQVRWQEESYRRRSARFSLGLMLAGVGVALIVLRLAIPQFRWPTSLTGLFELVGVAMILCGVVLAGSAVRER